MQTRLDSIYQSKSGQRTHIKNLQVLFTEMGLVKKAQHIQSNTQSDVP